MVHRRARSLIQLPTWVLVDDKAELEMRRHGQVRGRDVIFVRPVAGGGTGGAGAGQGQVPDVHPLAQVDHKNVQRLLEVLVTDEGPVLVLEAIPGESLADRIAREGTLDAQEVASIGSELADALGALHGIGALHRDIAPENVMIRPDGSTCLECFGWVDVATEGGEVSIGAEQGRSDVGLPRYPAPEQLAGKPASRRTDFFGLGCLLHLCLTGREAFHERSEVRRPPTTESMMLPGVPEALAREIGACLALSPGRRPRSAHDLAGRLRAAVRGSPPAPPRPGVPWRWRSAVVAALVLLAIGIFVKRPGRVDADAGRGVSPSARGGDVAGGAYAPAYGRSRALLIGIGQAYGANGFPVLPNARRDVQALAQRLESLPGRWEVTTLLDGDATHDGILAAKADLERDLRPDDQVLIFYAGHGRDHDASSASGWMIPADGRTLEDDPSRSRWLRFDEFARFFREVPAKHVLVAMDCCYGGRLATWRSQGATGFEERYLTRPARLVIASGRPNERVSDGVSGEHSPFAAAFLRVLSGGEEAVTSSRLFVEIEEEFRLRGVPHTPMLGHPEGEEPGEFVFFLNE